MKVGKEGKIGGKEETMRESGKGEEAKDREKG